MRRKLREFLDWLSEMRTPVIVGMAIGGFIVYIYTIDQIYRDCKVMYAFRVNATVFDCKVQKV